MPVYKLGKDRIVAISYDGFVANFLRPEDGKDGILVIVQKNLKEHGLHCDIASIQNEIWLLALFC